MGFGVLRSVGLVILALACVLARPAAAEPAAAAPPAKVVVAVLGDSMADGLWGGLFRAWRADPSTEALRRAKTGSGLGHVAMFDWFAGTRQILAEDKPDIVVVTIGLNDRVSLISDKRSIAFGSRDWAGAYAERVDKMMATLHDARIPTVWIGLPLMRDEESRRDARLLNAIFAERAARHGITFVPMWTIAGSAEEYEAYGTDRTGRRRLLRAEDGVHYTGLGYDLLADHLRETLAPIIAQVRAAKAAPPAQAQTAPPAPPAPAQTQAPAPATTVQAPQPEAPARQAQAQTQPAQPPKAASAPEAAKPKPRPKPPLPVARPAPPPAPPSPETLDAAAPPRDAAPAVETAPLPAEPLPVVVEPVATPAETAAVEGATAEGAAPPPPAEATALPQAVAPPPPAEAPPAEPVAPIAAAETAAQAPAP